MPAETPGRVRRALLIGINEYTKRPLDACVADAELMATLLRDRFAFAPENITLLRNRLASRDAVLSELDALVDVTGTDDVAFVFYAGHGALAKNVDSSEASGFDNTLNVCDDPREDIYDHEIEARLQALAARTRYTVMVVDACNSATIARDVVEADSAGPRPKERWNEPLLRAEAPMFDLGPHAATGTRSVDGYTLIAACLDHEIAKESTIDADTQEKHGALTCALAIELRQAPDGATWRDVFERAARAVTNRFGDQHPQIEGRVDLELFGMREFAPMPSVAITDRATTSVVLDAGLLHGVTVGTVYDVYPQGTKRTDDVVALGTVRVSTVKGTSARAMIVSEAAPGVIVPGSRAVTARRSTVEEALAIENVDPASRLTGKVTLEILRQGVDGAFVVATDDAAAGLPVFTSGERIAFRIRSDVDQPLYVNLFDFDPTGVVSALTKGNANRLAPREPFEIGNRDGRTLRMQWDADDAVQSFKLYASVRDVNLTYLTELNLPVRAVEELPPISVDDWTTVTRRVLLRRAVTSPA